MIEEALTFDDVLLLPQFSSVLPSDTDISVELGKNIKLKNVYYNYPNSQRTALKDLNITIPARSTVGLVGATGSGKTTTVDIILGLLEAQQGTLEVDEKIIDKNNKRIWQNSIGYVPQNIYLADETIASNISFGIDSEKIDQKEIGSKLKETMNLLGGRGIKKKKFGASRKERNEQRAERERFSATNF